MKLKKLLAFFLAALMMLSVFASCGRKETETDVSETETETATETEKETQKETETETERRPQRETEAKPELPPGVLMSFDFESTDSLYRYFKRFGVSLNSALAGGILQDGRWNYQGSALAFKDDFGIYDLNAYSVEFDFCFNSFVNKVTSVFTFITDDDGVLNGESSFYMALRMNEDGTIFNGSAAALTFQVEKGKTYHFAAEVNHSTGKISIYINGELLLAPSYTQAKRAYNCFRIMDSNRGADMWIDNFVIRDKSNAAAQKQDGFIYAEDAAFVRGGSYAGTPQKLAEGMYVDIKYATGNVYREGLLKFNISSLEPGDVQYTMFYGSYINMGADRTFDIYWVDSDWTGETVTLNNRPIGKLIVKNYKFSGGGAQLDLSTYIEEALVQGDEYFSIRIVPTSQIGDGQTRILFTESEKPRFLIVDEKPDKNYFQKLIDDEEKNEALWTYAQKMYDEWYARYQALPAVNEDAIRLPYNAAQYTKTNYSSGNANNYANTKVANKSRPLAALGDYAALVSDEIKNAKRDVYGGLMVESMKQTATGYFYAKKIDGRWFLVDPLGYPYISIGLSDIHYSQLGSQLQKDNVIKAYGTYDAWALATTRRVKDELFFNSSARPVEEIKKVKDGLPFIQSSGIMSSYGSIKGIRGDGNGSTVFTENNTMPVFDPDFASYAKSWAKTTIKYQGEAKLIGYTSDNELPMNVDMLDLSLTVDFTKDVNHYTYACAWTFLKNMTGKENPSFEDITDELRDLFRGFVWDRYFYIVANAIKEVDPDHMYMGTRFLTVSKDSEWVYRFAAQYLDCMTINWYFEWEPKEESLYGIARNGDMPFIVTEFYTKAGDSGLGNTSGAGRYVATQTDRADFYDTFTLRLLESQNCVGWQWFQYMDNDPNSGTGDKSSIDSNKGIFASDLKEYTVFTDRMKVLNEDAYELIFYFINGRQK